MIKSHLVFPGAFAQYLDDAKEIINNAQPKHGSGTNSIGVTTNYYGGGYVSEIENNTFYYFVRGNELNWGYDIRLVDSVRTEHLSQGSQVPIRCEQNHFYQNYTDRKLIGIMNLNDKVNEETGGYVILHHTDGYEERLDDIFFTKTGSLAVFDSFTSYSITSAKQPLDYMILTCSGNKFV